MQKFGLLTLKRKQKKHQPPRIPDWLLRRMRGYRDDYLIMGDLSEVFQEIYSFRSCRFARCWFWIQTIGCLPGYLTHVFIWRISMFQNSIKMAFRHIKKYKSFSFINVFGLATGMACCMLILIWVQNELSYDCFHTHADAIYRVQSNLISQPRPLAPALKDGYPEIRDAVRFFSPDVVVRFREKIFEEERFFFADPSVFDMFSFSFIKGDPATALRDRYSVVLTQDMAEKYFGHENPIGKTLQIQNQYDLNVTGIIQNVPQNSHLRFDFLGSFELYGSRIEDSWSNHAYLTYILLEPNITADQIRTKISDIVMKHSPIVHTPIDIQPLRRIHLYEDGAITYVYIFSAIAVFVLVIACINFMNLMTARYGNRIKEIGLKKVVGACRSEMIRQFFLESILYSVLSGAIAVIAIVLILPRFNAFLETRLTLAVFKNASLFLGLPGIVLFTGLLSGAYPALFLSAFRPARLLGQTAATTKGPIRGSVLRRILVITQFAISIGLIVSTLIVSHQMYYIRNMDLGFDKEQLLYMRLKGSIFRNGDAFKADLTRHANIISATFASSLPTNVGNNASGFGWEGMDPNRKPSWQFVATDLDYVRTLGLEIVKGRNFSGAFTTGNVGFVINEKAAAEMGFDSPVGKRFFLWGTPGTIIGVIKDFHFRPVHNEIKPMFMFVGPEAFMENILIRVNPRETKVDDIVSALREVWQSYAPGFPFEFHFIDEALDRNYRDEEKLGQLFKYFTGFAILISCLGLFGLAAYMSERRTKEIGIRKTLGASIPRILLIMIKDFFILVGAANLVAWPLAYLFMNRWLQHFAYHIRIVPGIFLISGLLASLIALMTVSTQAFRAARVNPVDALRYE